MSTTITLRKTGEIARKLCINYTEVARVIERMGIKPVMVLDDAARYDDAAFERIATAIAKSPKREATA